MLTKIAIVGHANAGKTTMIRTMLKGLYGKVEDRAGSTEVLEVVPYPALDAEFIDTPGFQKAGRVFDRLEGDMSKVSSLEEEKFSHEKAALEAIIGADACIYLASVETVPDGTHIDELQLVHQANPSVIAVLNKTNGASKSRVRQWEDLLRTARIRDVYPFDSHWDRYSKLNTVYTAIAAILPDEKGPEFQKRVQSLIQSFADASQQIAHAAAGCLVACRNTSEKSGTEKYGYSKDRTVKELRTKVIKEISSSLSDFSRTVQRTYRIAVNSDIEAPELKEDIFSRVGDRVGEIAKGGAVGGGIGAIVGAAVGFVVAGPPGALVGAQLGGGFGGTAGLGVGAVTEVNHEITIELREKDLRNVASACLAIVWCATRQGFGNSPSAAGKAYDESRQVVNEKIRISHREWRTCAEAEIIEWFSDNIRRLDADESD